MLRFRRNIYRKDFFTYYRSNPRNYSFDIFFFHFINLFVNSFGKHGNVAIIKKQIFFVFFSLYYQFNKTDPFKIYYYIFEKLRPKTFLVSYRISGTVYKIPSRITTFKSFSIVFHYFRKSSLLNPHRSIKSRTLNLFKTIIKNPFNDLKKKRDEIHKTAYINYTYARRLK